MLAFEAQIRLIALDLDGTVFGDELVITPRMRHAIESAMGAGVTVTIATGRMYRTASLIADDLGIGGPIICYQGAMVRNVTNGITMLHETIPLELAKLVIGDAESQGLHVNVYLDDALYVSHANRQAFFYAGINMGLPITEVGDLQNWLDAQEGKGPTKLVIVTDEEQTDSVLARFTRLYDERLQVTKSHARFTEFTNKLCSKGRALAALAAKLGVEQQSVMAIGDGLNDLDMIAWAGLGVAMGTAPSAVQDAGKWVCPPLSEDGAAIAIERFILRQEI